MNDHAATIRDLEARLVDADADLAAVTAAAAQLREQLVDADADLATAKAAAEKLREQLTMAQEEREAWKHKYKTLNQELMCELRDPCGTIWEHAKVLQDSCAEKDKEITALKAAIHERKAPQ